MARAWRVALHTSIELGWYVLIGLQRCTRGPAGAFGLTSAFEPLLVRRFALLAVHGGAVRLRFVFFLLLMWVWFDA